MGKSKIDFKKVLMGLLCGTLIGFYFISLWNDDVLIICYFITVVTVIILCIMDLIKKLIIDLKQISESFKDKRF